MDKTNHFLRSRKLLFIFTILCSTGVFAQVSAPQPVLPIPDANQLGWQQMEYYSFVHLSVNTYTDMAWGFGNEDPQIFNPTELDCRQWARIAKEAGMKGIIFTAKHHSGFCLWPSKYTEYSVKNSPWRDGKGDMVRELAEACKEYGLKFGIYLSPWDRNHPDYGKPEYITYFRNQLTELLTNYGEIFEVWFDGANGGTGYYGGANENRKIDRETYYDWKNTYKLVRDLQPNIVIWNDGGDRADLRWVGTEAGYIGETNWSLLDSTGDVPEDMLRHGVENGNAWVPGEVNTSIRPEWFYHPKEDGRVKNVPQLMDTYYNSVGRNGTLLLNFPIMPNGLIHPTDEKNVLAFAEARKEAFANNLTKNAIASASEVRCKSSTFNSLMAVDDDPESFWATNDNTKDATLTLRFAKPITFNRFLVQEPIQLGQRVKSFTLEAKIQGSWKEIAKETTIGYKRILRFPTTTATEIRLNITDAKACPLISNLEVYLAPIILFPPIISRNQAGEVQIKSSDSESEVYYTLDGSLPSSKSSKYQRWFPTHDGKITVKAIAYDPTNQSISEVSEENFEISRKKWKVLGVADDNILNIIDGDEFTSWQNDKVPIDLIIDFGKLETISGFRYLPDQHWWAETSIITQYQFFISENNLDWKLVSEGEFSNIKNNPTWQVNVFNPLTARYIKLKALKTVGNNNNAGIAEIDIITK
ncbi:alpha-L-fucosidase [Lacihabitans lacunae]|uniref:alpha-L-fucosidase n=1 Tax=Lacihabitans lacunae TaxID=1028214 RepID=A0ABV7Z443_9BACT